MTDTPKPRCCTAAATDPVKHEDGADCAAALELMIAAALAALKPTHSTEPWYVWVNQGGFARKGHEARIALGADS